MHPFSIEYFETAQCVLSSCCSRSGHWKGQPIGGATSTFSQMALCYCVLLYFMINARSTTSERVGCATHTHRYLWNEHVRGPPDGLGKCGWCRYRYVWMPWHLKWNSWNPPKVTIIYNRIFIWVY